MDGRLLDLICCENQRATAEEVLDILKHDVNHSLMRSDLTYCSDLVGRTRSTPKQGHHTEHGCSFGR